MKYPFDIGTVVRLGDLNYDKLFDLERWCRDRRHDPGVLAEHEQLHRFLRQKQEEKNARALIRRELLKDRIERWVSKGGLKPGMRVKMRGCRDGKGIREVLRVVTAIASPPRVECRQIRILRSGMEDPGQITLHGVDKIAGVFVDGRWVPIREVLNRAP